MINREIIFCLNSTVPAPLDFLADDIYPDVPQEKGMKQISFHIGLLKRQGWGITYPGRYGYLICEEHAELLRQAFCGKNSIPKDEISELVGSFTVWNVRKAIKFLD
jgi:hypothetical protein